MPTLKPLFSKLLDATGSGSSPNSSKRSFRKINSGAAAERGHGSHAPSGRSSIGGDYNKRATGFRVSSQLELEVNQDYKLQNGLLPDYLRHSGNSWAREPGLARQHKSGPPVGGSRHIDDASEPVPTPLNHAAVPSATVQP
ncbi:MAG: hypothetical protein Q9169_000642 [Polycauliona sp. 2 TL-2023]